MARAKERRVPRALAPEATIEVNVDQGNKRADRQQILREIDVAAVLGENLAETNPKLTSVASFLNTVCGRAREPKKKKTNQAAATAGVVSSEAAVLIVECLPPLVVQATESFLPLGQVSYLASANAGAMDGNGRKTESNSELDKTDVVVFDDTEMSVGESSGEKSGSRSSSGSSSSSSCANQLSRKRAAEDSPERDPNETLRQQFPGAISHGASGCRVYIPAGIATEGCTVITVGEKAVAADVMMAGAMADAPMSARVNPLLSVTANAPTNPSTDSTVTASTASMRPEMTLIAPAMAGADAPEVMDLATTTVVLDPTRGFDPASIAMDTGTDATLGPSYACTNATYFVAVNAIVNVLAELLARTSVRVSICVTTRTPVAAVTVGARSAAAAVVPMIRENDMGILLRRSIGCLGPWNRRGGFSTLPGGGPYGATDNGSSRPDESASKCTRADVGWSTQGSASRRER